MTFEQNREPSEEESLDIIIESHLAELHTAMPGFIEKYDAATGKADVQPVLKRVYLDEDGQEVEVPYPVITNVPVACPRGGGAFVSLPLKKGDPVWLIFAERSLDGYLETDGAQQLDPQDARRHHISDAIAYPGGGTFTNHIPNAHADDLVVGLESGDAELHIKPNGEVWFKAGKLMLGANGAAKAMALAEKVEAEIQALRDYVAGHTHTWPGGMSPAPTTAPIVPPGAVGSTASSKVFADA